MNVAQYFYILSSNHSSKTVHFSVSAAAMTETEKRCNAKNFFNAVIRLHRERQQIRRKRFYMCTYNDSEAEYTNK